MGNGGAGDGLMALSSQQVRAVYNAVSRLRKSFRDALSGKLIVPPEDIPKVSTVSEKMYPGEPPPPPLPEKEEP